MPHYSKNLEYIPKLVEMLLVGLVTNRTHLLLNLKYVTENLEKHACTTLRYLTFQIKQQKRQVSTSDTAKSINMTKQEALSDVILFLCVV
jgi:hypothetical protein